MNPENINPSIPVYGFDDTSSRSSKLPLIVGAIVIFGAMLSSFIFVLCCFRTVAPNEWVAVEHADGRISILEHKEPATWYLDAFREYTSYPRVMRIMPEINALLADGTPIVVHCRLIVSTPNLPADRAALHQEYGSPDAVAKFVSERLAMAIKTKITSEQDPFNPKFVQEIHADLLEQISRTRHQRMAVQQLVVTRTENYRGT